MKRIYILFLIICACCILLSPWDIFAASIDIPGVDPIKDISTGTNIDISENIGESIREVIMSIIALITRILMGVMVLFVVYIGVQMIISMGSDEEKLSAAKRQLWYTIVALVFINIPGLLFQAFFTNNRGDVGWGIQTWSFEGQWSSNIFVNLTVFEGVTTSIVFFIEIMIFAAAIFMITLTSIRLLISRWKEERVTEAKNKILYSILALVFVGIIEAWKSVAYSGSIDEGKNIFESLANLALFFAAPVAIFFLSLAGYYYITSNGDEERTKKAKSIIVNTVIATILLVASYTFLIELSNFF